MVLTGGADKTVVLFNSETETVQTTFKGHQKKIAAVILHPTEQISLSASHDSQVFGLTCFSHIHLYGNLFFILD